MARTFKGRSYTWQISDQAIGSGDAGEVYAAACLEDPSLEGVMKKPAHVATGGTIQRQAGQIAQESLALARLEGLPRCKAHPPRLLDLAPEFTQGTANYFMVSEAAPGKDMASMVAESRQNGKPFPRRVIITVLDALFDLFARAHRAGVLWNDVKLDHIYWHNPTGQIAVIDWGNAQFLDQPQDKARRALPRWEDYQQLVNTLGSFLQQSAPELYVDLGWEEFQDKELDLPQVSVLARRIAYQQQVIGLRVMEYQSLIRVVLSADPGIDGLIKIRGYSQRLDEIGATWDKNSVLNYAKSLVIKALADGDTNSAIKATTIVWDLFDDSLDLSWHLLREYFRLPDLIAHQSLYQLGRSTLNENWGSALWTLTIIAHEKQNPNWWEHLMPVLRQKAMGNAISRPYQIGLSLLSWVQSQGVQKENSAEKISEILQNWRLKGDSLEGNPFDYLLLEYIQNNPEIPKHILSEAKQSFAEGQEALRELVKAWQNMTWDDFPKSLQKLINWDPNRWGIIKLSNSFETLQSWMIKLYESPLQGVGIPVFMDEIINNRPRLEKILGSPPWVKSLDRMLKSLRNGEPVSQQKMEVTHWCPWLLNYKTIYDEQQVNADDEIVQNTLLHFTKHLKNWSDLDTGLEDVRRDAPQYHPAAKKLVNHFQAITNLNADVSIITADCQVLPHPTLNDTCQVLHSLVSWRDALSDKEYPKALSLLEGADHQDWRIINHAHETTALWIDEIQPLLKAIASQELPPEGISPSKENQKLINIAIECHELKENWEFIYNAGINAQLLEKLTKLADANRSGFLDWRRSFEHSGDRFYALLYHFDLEGIRSISDDLLRLSQHSRQAHLNFSELSAGEELPFGTLMETSSRLLNHLSKVEAVLVTSQADNRFPGLCTSGVQRSTVQ
ncbi:MAG: hypothetical protein P1P73_09650 [Brevefilum sp.]|nr:hypothetical protein [Brevefilum sp.]